MIVAYNSLTFYSHLLILSTFLLFNICESRYRNEQILFRENLLPNLGGKIPETALSPERIALNRLNQNGLYSPDGIYLLQRDINHIHKKYPLETLKIPNIAGTQNYHRNRLVDTTYVIRDPILITLFPIQRGYSPALPTSSLKLLSYNFVNKHRQDNNYNRKQSPDVEKVFNELLPYLKKLHEYD